MDVVAGEVIKVGRQLMSMVNDSVCLKDVRPKEAK